MFSQLFHQTPASGGGYWQTPINSWIIPAFPSHLLNFITQLQGVRYAAALISGVRKISTFSAAAENLVYTGTTVNLSSLCTITQEQTQCPFWGHQSVVTNYSSVPQNAPVASRLCSVQLQHPQAERVAIDTGDNRVREWPDRLSSCLKVSVLLS